MNAIDVAAGALSWGPTPAPEPGPGEVRITVHATAVNRADLVQRAGLYPPPAGASEILGLECAGVVDTIGEGVTRHQVGDEVCALLAGGGYAERVVCPAGHCLPLPPGTDTHTAAAIPEVFTTAWLNLWLEAGLQPGERVLLHAAASGVGTAALQLCRLFGNPVFATAGSDVKLAACEALGATGTHDRHAGSFREAVRAWGGADVILDPVGAAYLEDNQAVLKTGGRLVLIGLLGGRTAPVDLARLLVKRQRLIGSTLRTRPAAEKTTLLATLEREVWPAFGGPLHPVIDRVFDIRDADAAHAYVASNRNVGKVLLSVKST